MHEQESEGRSPIKSDEIEIVDMQLVGDLVDLTPEAYNSKELTDIKETSNEYSKSKSTVNHYHRKASNSYISAARINSDLKKSSS